MIQGMATSIRLPDDLKARASAHADRLGISLNALIAVALADYLDLRTTRPGAETGPATLGGPGPVTTDRPVHQQVPSKMPVPKGGMKAPCPCGSGRKYRNCCGRG